MPKLYLLGGENVFRRSAREVNERAFQDAGEPLVVLVFAWARASFDKGYKKRERLVDYFISLGASKVNFVEYSDSKETIAEKTSSSNLIYLTGGLVSVLIERLKNMEVDNLLRGYSGVIVGRSAGALALCKKCVITYRSNSKVKLVGGLGLVDFTLKAHYKPEKDNELKRLSKEEKIYAVPEGSALVYDNGASSFIGEAYLFENGKKRMLT
jgi:peptidase E